MTITSKLFDTVPGAYTFSSVSLLNVIILCVCRSGLGYDCKEGSAPGNREVTYDNSAASLTFQNSFEGDSSGATDIIEKIYVRYKY